MTMNSTQHAARVRGLDSIALRVPNLDEQTDFYTATVGLDLVRTSSDARFLATRGARFADVILRHGADAALDRLAFAVRSGAECDEIADRLHAAGLDAIPITEDGPDKGVEKSMLTSDPDGNFIELVVGSSQRPEPPEATRVVPETLGHVVLATPRRDDMEAFYAILGLRVTDRTQQGLSFLRCNADHHTLALMDADTSWVQHIAYDVGTIDEVMMGMASLATNDVKPIWGPGRHGPGNNIFTYYKDPAGFTFEFYGELEQFDPLDQDGDVYEWPPTHRGDIWGVAGRPPEQFLSRVVSPRQRRTTTTSKGASMPSDSIRQ